MKLTCLDSASQWEFEQTSKYHEVKIFIDSLKRLIVENPEKGVLDPFIFLGKTLPFRKRMINISIFPARYAIGYSYITAHYLLGSKEIVIVRFGYA